MANLTISMSATDKAGISAFCEATGFTISSLFNVFTKAVLRERRLPFQVIMPETPNAETIAAMEEGERMEYDNSAYRMYHRLNVDWPCLSFDIITDNLGVARKRVRSPSFCHL